MLYIFMLPQHRKLLPNLHAIETWFSMNLYQWFLYFSTQWNYVDNLLKHRQLSLTPGDFDSVVFVWNPRFCISNKFPVDADVTGLETKI